MESPIRTDFLVLGSGIAGLWFALNSARFGKVLVLTKKGDTDSNTNYAQGGIAAAFGITDSPELHCLDTMKAGEGLCREEVVRAVVSEGPRLVETLNSMGVEFTTYQDGRGQTHFDLGREGGHRRARIVHAHDYTGREVESSLVGAVRNHPRVTILQNHFAVDLIIDTSGFCRGCQAINESTNALQVVLANVTLLATGGIGQVYQYTTNPRIATGDGIAMAFRAGARIANMEFIQFHPTALYGHTIEGRAFLISEALRGEGAVLKTQDGMTFMERYHELGSLAPRDVVARAANAEMKRRGDRYVLLDATHLDPGRLEQRFPNIFSQCLKFGIDIRREPIPVVP
ncbi:MAG: FAD-binding protein, partial [candidate division WOR-3 bacterium]